MRDEGRDDFRQDLVDAEYGSGGSGLGPSGGQVGFDLLFGLVAPIVLLVADPALFVADVADRAALPPYWAVPTYVAVGALLTGLLLWGVTGMRLPVLGMLLAGPFAAGALLFLALGLKLLWFALVHSDLLSGWLAFTPWLTAIVFVRHCVLACRAGASRSVGLSILALLATFAGALFTLWSVGAARRHTALVLEGQLLGDSVSDFEYACSRIHSPWQLDMDSVAETYAQMEESDPRRLRIKDAYSRITGAPIAAALRRLFPRTSAAIIPPESQPKEEDPNAAKLEMLFSASYEQYLQAASDLITLDPDPKLLAAIALRYSRLPEDDPRREWVEKAYTSLNSDGDTIKDALKRIQKKAGVKDKGQPPPDNAPKAPTPKKAPRPPAPTTAHDTP